jgi:hypothetical protein
MKAKDILFVKETLLRMFPVGNRYNKESKILSEPSPIHSRTSKVKKWTPIEVGRLLFCLW